MQIDDIDILQYFSGAVLGVAVSGGRDSMALLDYLLSQRKKNSYAITVINIEHGIRGSESTADSLFVEDYCREREVPFIGSAVDALSYAKRRGITLEQAARELRYRIFDKLLEEKIVDAIALAHHLDDQCETLLMRMFRGTGLNGLIGIQAVRGGYIRPFLHVTREQIDRYISEKNIPYREDSTNSCNEYSRNYLRGEVLPKIEARYPQYRRALARLSRIASEQIGLLDSLAARPELAEGEARIEIDYLKTAHIALVKRSFYYCMKHLGAETDFEESNIEALLTLKDKANGSSIDLAFGVCAHKEYRHIVLCRRQEVLTLDIPFAAGEHDTALGVITVREYRAGDRIRFDYAKIPKGARIRTRREGDFFTKFGGGTKSLGDYFTDKKVPKRIRDSLILIALDKEIFAISGMEISAKIAVDDTTEKVFTMLEEKY